MKIIIVLFNENKKVFGEKRMKIYTSLNQNLIDFVFIVVFVCGKVSWGCGN